MNQETEFLQSECWLLFQEAAGKEVVRFSDDSGMVRGVVHTLPVVGRYLYTPRWPGNSLLQSGSSVVTPVSKLLAEARKRKVNWVRIEPEAESSLGALQKEFGKQLVKAPHDMQPREIFIVDITPSPETLLARMKAKTRYNISLAEKRGVNILVTREKKYEEAFLDLIKATAFRKEITPHPRSYYEKFFSVFSKDECQLFVAEYEGKVLAANLLMIFGTRAIYLHGGSGNDHRDVMAPYLLQWQQIRYAKERGCTEYDFGGVRTEGEESGKMKDDWAGITRFKRGFSPETEPVAFPGAYDIILNHSKYVLYNRLRMFQESLSLMKKFLKW